MCPQAHLRQATTGALRTELIRTAALLLGAWLCACGGEDTEDCTAGGTCGAVTIEDAGSDAAHGSKSRPACANGEPCDCDGGEACAVDENDAGGKPTCELPGNSDCAPGSCNVDARRCDCHADLDQVLAWFCGGTDNDADGDGVDGNDCLSPEECDCDDYDRFRFPGNPEVCDADGRDDDCRLDTFGSRDRDRDNYPDAECHNRDPYSGEIRGRPPEEADCNDLVDETHPTAREDCDDHDNDCDGHVDELPGPREEHRAKEQQRWYCRDLDGDGWSRNEDKVQRCGPPVGYVLCLDNPRPHEIDCDESVERGLATYPGADEICDGYDNDCDGNIDVPARDHLSLLNEPVFSDGTGALCEDGTWLLSCPHDKAWCDTTTYKRGCETDATRLDRCRSCEDTKCSFACGQGGCDEVAMLDVGSDFACAITAEKRAACWGHGLDGRLGNGDMRSAAVPQLVLDVKDVKSIALGTAHACLISGEDNSVYCWGSNERGELGTPDVRLYSSAPVPVYGVWQERQLLGNALRVATGMHHSCAVLADNGIACWGETENGRLGDGSTAVGTALPQLVDRIFDHAVLGPSTTPVTDAADVALGDEHSCLVTIAGAVECWGSNGSGQLGTDPGVTAFSAMATLVAELSAVEQIAAGAFHTCALAQGRVFCWGSPDTGKLGRVGPEENWIPKQVLGLPLIAAIAAGHDSSCARSLEGSVYCWGANGGGQLGSDILTVSETPVLLDIQEATQIAMGGSSCAQTQSRHVYCWGANHFGQLGNARTSSGAQPVPTLLEPLAGSRR